MRAVIAGAERQALLQEINSAFLQWPELERRIFSQAHYHGQSPEAISRSLRLDVKEVGTILKQCERRLYASLRSFRKSSGEEALLIRDGIALLGAHGQNLGVHAPAPR
jgi:DNA-directed RNA polymerase specialized sigma24 family protein